MNSKYIDYPKKEVHHHKTCLKCGKALRRFKNNKYNINRKDWNARPYHLKCWKERQEWLAMLERFKSF